MNPLNGNLDVNLDLIKNVNLGVQFSIRLHEMNWRCVVKIMNGSIVVLHKILIPVAKAN